MCLCAVFSRALVQTLWSQAKEIRFSIACGAKSAAEAAVIVRYFHKGMDRADLPLPPTTPPPEHLKPEPAGRGALTAAPASPRLIQGSIHRTPAAGTKQRGMSPGFPRRCSAGLPGVSAANHASGAPQQSPDGTMEPARGSRGGKGTHGLKASGRLSPSGALCSRLATSVLAGAALRSETQQSGSGLTHGGSRPLSESRVTLGAEACPALQLPSPLGSPSAPGGAPAEGPAHTGAAAGASAGARPA